MKDNTTIIIGGLAIAGVLAYLAYKKTLTATTAGTLRVGPSGVSGTINLQPLESAAAGLLGAAFAPSGSTQQNNNPSSGTAYTGVQMVDPNDDLASQEAEYLDSGETSE